jgi:RNA polymerase sigma factor (sigma-70 family)
MDKLIEDNMPLVASIVNKFEPRNHTERQDLLDAGRIGLWKALQKYDPSKGNLISTYAWRPIQWAIIRELKARQRHSSIEDAPTPSMMTPERVWEYFTSDMNDEEKRLIELRCQGYKFREICEIVGDTPSAVKNRFYKALRKIREGNDA